jgi:mono/diheme cytochrome c family protein
MQVTKKIIIGLSVVFCLVLILAVALHMIGLNRLNRAPTVATNPVESSSDPQAIERGRHLADITGCTSCHTVNLRGLPRDDSGGLYMPIPNLTAGKGGVGGVYTDADWERAIRHGVGKDGRTLILMPSIGYSHFGDDDLADLIAFLKSVPPIDNDLGTRKIGFPVSIIFGIVAYGDMAVNQIDHEAVGGAAPEREISQTYGEYLTHLAACRDCHMPNLAGNYGQSPAPQGPNITPYGYIGDWSGEEFATALQTGWLPNGDILSNEVETGMPWQTYAFMTDMEVQAIWEHLSNLEPLPNNQK